MSIAISFFTGAGGLDMGLHNSGFDIRLCVELEKKYCETFYDNNSHMNIVNGNIMEYNRALIYEKAHLNSNQEVSLVFGGSPCQSFSTAGKRQAFDDPRGMAMIQFADIISQVKPRSFILENVRGLLSTPLKHRPHNQRGEGFPPLEEDEMRGSALKYILSLFKGYKVNYELVNSASYGVPQKRERVVIVGIREDLGVEFEFPAFTHGPGTLNEYVTFSDVIESIGNIEHEHVNYSKERMKYMKLIPKGGGYWRDLPSDVVKAAMGGAYESGGGKTGYFRRIYANRPAPTLLTSPIQKSTNIGHPFEDRPLSIQEYLIIQGFPIDYRLHGTISDKYTQIGNAVPVRLAEVIGRRLIELIEK